MTKIIIIILVGSLLLIFAAYKFISVEEPLSRGFPLIMGSPSATSSAYGVNCPTDAHICPDGSSIGRSGPQCEFICPDVNAEQITIMGTLECLPHKNTSGPQTMECAFGLKGDNGLYYGLSDPEWKFLIGAPMNTKVTVEGTFKPKTDTKYNSVGVIEIHNLEK